VSLEIASIHSRKVRDTLKEMDRVAVERLQGRRLEILKRFGSLSSSSFPRLY
jgi:hypothetical protein